MGASETFAAAPLAEYRRSARGLRAQFADDLPKLHRGLSALATAANRKSGFTPSSVNLILARRGARQLPGASSPASRIADFDESRHPLVHNLPLDSRGKTFADVVTKRLTTGLLTYSSRVALLRQAAALNIRPFDANLIIALVQQRVGFLTISEPDGESVDLIVEDRAAAWSLKTKLLAAILVQGAILFCIWKAMGFA